MCGFRIALGPSETDSLPPKVGVGLRTHHYPPRPYLWDYAGYVVVVENVMCGSWSVRESKNCSESLCFPAAL